MSLNNKEVFGGIGYQNNVKERIGSSKIEIRRADLERDAFSVATMFAQPSTIEHLSGIAPTERTSEVNVKRYGEKYPDLNIVIATEEGIRKFYNGSSSLFVAEDKSTRLLVGTITIERPTGPGLTYASISRIVVAEEARGRGIGTKLLESADALVFLPKEQGGYGQFGAQAGIIQGVTGCSSPLALFLREGYNVRGNPEGNCVSWDNRLKRFVPRNTILVQLDSQKFSALHDSNKLIKKVPH